MNTRTATRTLIFIGVLVILNIIASFFFFRWDLTSEKRYSISPQTKKLLKNLDQEMNVTVYLDGDLNSGFLRLKKATEEMLDEFKIYGKKNIVYHFEDPSDCENDEKRYENYRRLYEEGFAPIEVNEKDSEGKSIQKIVFPWAKIICGKDTAKVNLLKKAPGKTGYENLNISIENLEFELTDAIRSLTQKEIQKIAFLEGHNELPEIYTYDITQTLSKYFQIDRGIIGDDASVLDPYKVLVIAAPENKFTESEKFVIDQYIMNGGRVLWLTDGVKVSMDTISAYNMSPVLPNDVNLNDQLFRYGIRVNNTLIEDAQCILIPVAQGSKSGESSVDEYQPTSWYFSPLLQPVATHPVSRNLNLVKSDFASSIDFVGTSHDIKKSILLTTSNYSKALQAPLSISLEILDTPIEQLGLTESNIPVAVALEGKFTSVFKNRMKPKNIITSKEQRNESEPTKMIVVADGDIIRNDIRGTKGNVRPMPLGFDPYTGQEFGNRTFITNAILYLADDEGWFTLRSRELKLRMLDKTKTEKNKKNIQMFNILLPISILLIFGIGHFWWRRRKFAK
ncbi:MAG: gliding motility-associated ABC transporter substrate-binding protein GldG [Bacteroidales bacterium]|nr:gliding motility-associated ABC transporter substrate-binding protein GldG [Bacteroidales bacterium]